MTNYYLWVKYSYPNTFKWHSIPRMLENILETVPLKSRKRKSRTTQEPSNPNLVGVFQSPLCLQAMPLCVTITLSAIGNNIPAVTTSLLDPFLRHSWLWNPMFQMSKVCTQECGSLCSLWTEHFASRICVTVMQYGHAGLWLCVKLSNQAGMSIQTL